MGETIVQAAEDGGQCFLLGFHQGKIFASPKKSQSNGRDFTQMNGIYNTFSFKSLLYNLTLCSLGCLFKYKKSYFL